MGLVLGPRARNDRTRDTRVTKPWLPASEDGQPGEGQRLSPDAPHNGGRPPPPGTAPHHPCGTQPPQGMQARGTVWDPHTDIPAPTARGWRTSKARPVGGQSGEGQRLTSDALHNCERHPPRGRPSATPTASNAGSQGCTLQAGAGSPRPHRPHPGHTGRGTPATRSRGWAAGAGTAPDTRRPSQWWKAPPPGTPFRQPHSEQRRSARAHAVGPVLGPHARTDRTRDTLVAEPWLPAPEDGRLGEGKRLTPEALTTVAAPPPRGRPPATPAARSCHRAYATNPPHGGRTAPSQVGGNRDRTAPPRARQTEQGTRGGHAEGHGPRGTALLAPSARTARGAHATPPRGGGADAAGARAHTHAKGTRGLPEGQPDRARGTHRPRGMAYQRARVRDTRTGRPATRSAGHAGRERGNRRDTTPGTGPSPPNRPRAPRTHGRGTAPAKAVVAHCTTPQPLGQVASAPAQGGPTGDKPVARARQRQRPGRPRIRGAMRWVSARSHGCKLMH